MQFPFDQSLLMPSKLDASVKQGADIYSTILNMLAMPEMMKTQRATAQEALKQKQLNNQYLTPESKSVADRENLINQYGGADSDQVKLFDSLLQNKNKSQNQWQSNIGRTQADLQKISSIYGTDSQQYKDAQEQYQTQLNQQRAMAASKEAYAKGLPFMMQPVLAKTYIEKKLAQDGIPPEKWAAITSDVVGYYSSGQGGDPDQIYAQSVNQRMTPQQGQSPPMNNQMPPPLLANPAQAQPQPQYAANPQQIQSMQANANTPAGNQIGMSVPNVPNSPQSPPIPNLQTSTPDEAARAQEAAEGLGSYIDMKTTPIGVQTAKYAGRRAEQITPFIQKSIDNGALEYNGLEGKAKEAMDHAIAYISGTTPQRLQARQQLEAELHTQKSEMAQMMKVPADIHARNELNQLFDINSLSKNPDAAKAQLNNTWQMMQSQEDVNFSSLEKLRKENEKLAKQDFSKPSNSTTSQYSKDDFPVDANGRQMMRNKRTGKLYYVDELGKTK